MARTWTISLIMNTFITQSSGLDLVFSHAININGLFGQNLLLDHIANRLENSQLKGFGLLGYFCGAVVSAR